LIFSTNSDPSRGHRERFSVEETADPSSLTLARDDNGDDGTNRIEDVLAFDSSHKTLSSRIPQRG
jgi:hypothetical protein